jgi:hypothetical protein
MPLFPSAPLPLFTPSLALSPRLFTQLLFTQRLACPAPPRPMPLGGPLRMCGDGTESYLAGCTPAACRLVDNDQFRFGHALKPEKKGMTAVIKSAVQKFAVVRPPPRSVYLPALGPGPGPVRNSTQQKLPSPAAHGPPAPLQTKVYGMDPLTMVAATMKYHLRVIMIMVRALD